MVCSYFLSHFFSRPFSYPFSWSNFIVRYRSFTTKYYKQLNAERKWSFALFSLAVVVHILMYPLVWTKKKQRQKYIYKYKIKCGSFTNRENRVEIPCKQTNKPKIENQNKKPKFIKTHTLGQMRKVGAKNFIASLYGL